VSKKRLLTVAIGVVIMASLVGTSIAMDGKSPFELIWQAIFDLQARVTALEENAGTNIKVKTIRLVESTESIVSEPDVLVDIAIFTWVPMNKTNNAVLSIASYAECKGSQEYVHVGLRVLVGNEEAIWAFHTLQTEYQWSPVFVSSIRTGEPNQSSYEIRVQSILHEGTAYFRNINVIMTVADGLPPSN